MMHHLEQTSFIIHFDARNSITSQVDDHMLTQSTTTSRTK